MRIKVFIFVISFALVYGLPVTKHVTEEKPPEPNIENEEDVKIILEYERYLKEVLQALESDPEFQKKLDKAPEADIRNGKIAQELDYVSHNVRTKLDELKRQEIERLRHFANKEYELTNDIDRTHMKVPQHLDHENEHTFEIEDLRKLILKTAKDLAEADQKRREEFKNYEMQKEFEIQQKMKGMDEQHRKEYEKQLAEKKKKHNKHEKVHHPGSKAQLEEVWEKQDEMDRNDFDPEIFFKMHDLDENGFWDETEVKALFIKELDKVYQAGVPEDDMRERAEEMENMREHVFKETDTNGDKLISFQEFINKSKSKDFESDPGWETVDNSTPYTQNEYKQFEMQREEEIKRLIEQGKLPPHPVMPDGYYNYEAVQPGYVQQQGPPMQMSNQHPPMNGEIHRDAIQQQQQQQYAQGHYPQQQQPMPQYHVPQAQPTYQQQIPQYLPQQVPVDHVPHQQMHVPQMQQQQQIPQYHQQAPQQQQNVPQYQQIPQQQQQFVPPQPIQQAQQVVQASEHSPQAVVPQQQQQQQQQATNIQPPINSAPSPPQPVAAGQNDIPQVKTNHV